MHTYAIAFVLLSAVLHATWNAQLKGGTDRPQFMASMSLVVGLLCLVCTPFVPFPSATVWAYLALSVALHIAYNLLLVQNYKMSDFSSAYPIARGVSPLLVTLGGFLLMHQRPGLFGIMGVATISAGIVFLATGRARASRRATLSALATGVTIAAYTVVDGMAVQRSPSTVSYTVWLFAGYLLVPVVMLALRYPVRAFALRRLPPYAAAAGVFSLIAYTLVLWATHYADVGIVSALRETSVLWAVVFAHLFLGERFTARRVASATCICCGVILLVALSH